jgi:dinuclear metal center YbgI/SA1388 family protein
MAVLLAKLQTFLDDTLKPKTIKDYCPNGLQVEGNHSVSRLACAVTASSYVIEQAIAWGAQALLVHHGLFWHGQSPCVVGLQRQRIALLLKHGISLLAYHLPLDVHLSLGNNAQLAQRLGIEVTGQQAIDGVNGLLWQGRLPMPQSPLSLMESWQACLGRAPLLLGDPLLFVQSLAWCTGGAQKYFQQAIDLGVDAYVSGEVSESQYHLAQESGVRFFACGHHATERYGVQALSEAAASALGVDIYFIDEKNPV